ncbi:FKBP-type peptidyl-prolyl isomerase-like protein [Anseongella ginsenosidimutans]|uniref:Peptidyl-prolyl cis-trans isomerase n=1 Tax=Anseongella ginsenosidimutans TaxID=496056 RepID=A0A4R3KQN0_9SPHI|nr:FKBP-type peptidyl-prolyl cis-trans isomerase [Anseongella ginsenosidimutans]TCS86820.1 FKBP-type peptidyl-prolyl isomerase-like protein [Anseongella ginsenosidimutans]
MKKQLLVLTCLIAVLLTSCLSDDYVDRNSIDQQIIQEYIQEKGLTLEYDANSGIHYKIIRLGDTTRRPSPDSSQITVNYEGRLLTDTIFVKGDSVEMDLARQPIGFQLGVSSIGEGGEIMMILPSLVSYGSASFVTDTPYSVLVPPFSVLVYEVELLKVGE